MSTLEQFQKWTARGDAVALYENRDLGHPEAGRKIAIPVTQEERKLLKPGESKAPDTRVGFGWRYILVASFDNPHEAARRFGDIGELTDALRAGGE